MQFLNHDGGSRQYTVFRICYTSGHTSHHSKFTDIVCSRDTYTTGTEQSRDKQQSFNLFHIIFNKLIYGCKDIPE